MQISNGVGKNRILFYSSIPRTFRTTLIAHLYEISQVWPVVLLSEKLDQETKEILKNKTLFPQLEEIVPVNLFKMKKNLFFENIHVYRLARNIIRKYKPTMLILPGDSCLFDFYLMRFAKKINAISVVHHPDLRFWGDKEMSLRADLTHAHFKFPPFLPFALRLFLARARKYCGYLLYNFLLPLSVGQAPFWGKSSRIFYTIPGLRADYRIAFSKENYNFILKEGVSKEKIIILEHPMKREITRRFLKKIHLSSSQNRAKKKRKTLTLLYPEESYGFRRSDYSLIEEKEMQKNRIETVKLITDILKGWEVFIKPHPAIHKSKELKKIFEKISPLVVFVNPSESINKYIELSDAIVGLPPVSTALFTASLQCPEKPILSLDLPPQEILGDCYKGFEGIEHIDNEEKFIEILELIRDNKYFKNYKTKLESEGFSGTAEVIEYLLKNKKTL